MPDMDLACLITEEAVIVLTEESLMKEMEGPSLLGMTPSGSVLEEERKSPEGKSDIQQTWDDLFKLSLQLSDVISTSDNELETSKVFTCSAFCLFINTDAAQKEPLHKI